MSESDERLLTVDARVLRGPIVRVMRDTWNRLAESNRLDGKDDSYFREKILFCEQTILNARLPGVTHLVLSLNQMYALGLEEPGPQPSLPVDLDTITRSEFAALLTKWGLEVRKTENTQANLGWRGDACLWSALTGKSLMAGEGL